METGPHAGLPPRPSDDPAAGALLDGAIADLTVAAPRWCETGPLPRIELLRAVTATVLATARTWARAEATARAGDAVPTSVAEVWSSVVIPLLRQLRLLEASLNSVLTTGRTVPAGLRVVPSTEQVRIDVFPADRLDRLLMPGFRAEIRLQPNRTIDRALASMGGTHRTPSPPRPGVALVLGPGNLSSVGPMDALHQLFVEDRVVLLKPSPLHLPLAGIIADAFAPLLGSGFLRIVQGGADVGARLADHAGVDAIHVTGTAATRDALVLATGEEGRLGQRRGAPHPAKTVTAQLGSVTPVIVVPGPWSERDLAYQGDNVAAMLVSGSGFTCVNVRVIIQHQAWSRRRALLDAIRASLRGVEDRTPNVPGAVERWRRVTEAHTTAEWFGEAGDGSVPFTLIPDLDPDAVDDIAFTTDVGCGVVGEVGLDTDHAVPEYLAAAVRFCNDTLAGDLAVSIIVHPRSLADPAVADAVERAVDDLDYGTVVVNHFPGVAYALGSTPWGGFAGGGPSGNASSVGFVHNPYRLEGVHKSVVRGPFRPATTPWWFHTSRAAPATLPKVARATATGRLRRPSGLLWPALRGSLGRR